MSEEKTTSILENYERIQRYTYMDEMDAFMKLHLVFKQRRECAGKLRGPTTDEEAKLLNDYIEFCNEQIRKVLGV